MIPLFPMRLRGLPRPAGSQRRKKGGAFSDLSSRGSVATETRTVFTREGNDRSDPSFSYETQGIATPCGLAKTQKGPLSDLSSRGSVATETRTVFTREGNDRSDPTFSYETQGIATPCGLAKTQKGGAFSDLSSRGSEGIEAIPLFHSLSVCVKS